MKKLTNSLSSIINEWLSLEQIVKNSR